MQTNIQDVQVDRVQACEFPRSGAPRGGAPISRQGYPGDGGVPAHVVKRPGSIGPHANNTSLLESGVVGPTYGFQLPDEDMLSENLDSINRITAYVSRRTGRK